MLLHHCKLSRLVGKWIMAAVALKIRNSFVWNLRIFYIVCKFFADRRSAVYLLWRLQSKSSRATICRPWAQKEWTPSFPSSDWRPSHDLQRQPPEPCTSANWSQKNAARQHILSHVSQSLDISVKRYVRNSPNREGDSSTTVSHVIQPIFGEFHMTLQYDTRKFLKIMTLARPEKY